MSKALSAMNHLFGSWGRGAKPVLLAAIAVVALVASTGTASAAYTHVFDEEFEASGCAEIEEIAADFTHDWLYVTCNNGIQRRVVKRYTMNGTPAPFSADAEEPYLEGNTITEDPGGENGEGRIGASNFYIETAVDNSGGVNNGDFFLNSQSGSAVAGDMSILEPSGKLKFAKVFGVFPPEAITVDPNGNIYVINTRNTGYIRKFNSAVHEIGTICDSGERGFAKADSHEGLWVARASLGSHNEDLTKLEPDAFSTRTGQVDNGGCLNNRPELEELGMPFPAPRSPFVPALNTGAFTAFEVDPTNDNVMIDHKTGSGREIWSFSSGTAEEPSHRDAPPFGAGKLKETTFGFMAADDQSNVYVANEGNNIVKFKRGSIVPDVRTPKVATQDIGHQEATVRAHLETAGGPPITECKVFWGKTEVEAEEEVHTPLSCSPNPSGSPFTSDTDVSAKITGLATNVKYRFYFVAGNANGSNRGVTREVIPVAVLNVQTEAASQIGQHEATLNGSFDADNLATEYWFEYGLNSQYGSSTPIVNAAAPGSQSVSAPISEIPAGRKFHYRLVARNSLGTTRGADVTFRTSAAPEISAVRASQLTGATATLNAHIDPVGEPTTYEFVYGQTPAYGNSVPIGGASLASATEAEDVSQVISGLQPGLTYHFAVVATNAEGTTQSPDNTFDFEPPLCPNAHVRQQTHASYLPDCRAYELVSPGDAGSVLMFPSDSIGEFSFKEGRQAGKIWPVNTGLATNPPRFQYFAGLGAVRNLDAPNFFFDQYVTTRTPTGWVTTLPGLKGQEALLPARMRCSDSLAVCIDHNEGDLEGPPVQIAANLFDVSGERLGTLPTNVGTIPNAEYEPHDQFGEEQLSGDGNHYVFSSVTHVYAPGGSTVTPGSVYDNDIAAKTVTLVSLTPADEPIPSELNNPEEYLELPAVSTDGSHILMAVGSSEGGLHLYMRVNQSVTYDVSEGTGVQLLGMTRDGSKVDFISSNRLSPEDTDNSADLYQWDENGGSPVIKLLSQGNGQGNTDECLPVGFGSQCDAVELQTERGHPFGLISTPARDSQLALKSGDAFFFSPENLDPQHPGVRNQKNLYEYHGNSVHYVATLDPGTRVNRIQISPDGLHAGILTASNLTGYDSHGKREMYTYDVETGNIQCASCRPDGLPPIASVTASEGGPFMADDGRVFFNTRDPLVPRDVDGELTDVYEFVNGRAQLITSGTESRDSTGGAKVANALGLPKTAITGLESVSADGRDVYFSTYDTLVPQDENGSFVKFYDARSNGGFEPEPKFAGCEAADECHGEGAPTAAPPVIGTGAGTGNSGQVVPQAKAKKAKRHRRHKRHAGKRRKQHRAGHQSGSGRRG